MNRSLRPGDGGRAREGGISWAAARGMSRVVRTLLDVSQLHAADGRAASASPHPQHGGQLTLESREGEGTTVLIRLPLHPARDGTDVAPFAAEQDGVSV